MGLTFAIIILALTFVLTWSARHHDRRQAHRDRDLAFLDGEESDGVPSFSPDDGHHGRR